MPVRKCREVYVDPLGITTSCCIRANNFLYLTMSLRTGWESTQARANLCNFTRQGNLISLATYRCKILCGKRLSMRFSKLYQYLPLRKPENIEKATEIWDQYTKSRPRSDSGDCPRRNWRVLLVEDCPDQQRLTCSFLRGHVADVDLECNGDASVGLVARGIREQKRFDLIILDLYLLDSNGIEATIRIRDLDPFVPVIGITAHATDDIRKIWMASGCDYFLAKPFTKEALLALVDKASRKSSAMLERARTLSNER